MSPSPSCANDRGQKGKMGIALQLIEQHQGMIAAEVFDRLTVNAFLRRQRKKHPAADAGFSGARTACRVGLPERRYTHGGLCGRAVHSVARICPLSVEARIGVRKCVGHQPKSGYRHRCGGYHIGAGRTPGRNKLCTHQQCPPFPNPTRS